MRLKPSRMGAAVLILGASLGAAAGLGAYTFIYAKGASYLGSDPAACANCHVMQGHFDAWARSGHGHVAACNDCHAPDGLDKWRVKAVNGFRHSLAFTTGRFPDPIRITEFNARIAEASCRRCHQGLVSAVEGHGGGREPVSCVRCHASAGH